MPPDPMPVSFESVHALPRRMPDREHVYGPSPSQRVQVWEPEGHTSTPPAVITLIHGGCWRASFGVDHIQPLATALAANGFAVWAPEYRRIGEPGGGWPGTFDDVATAVDLLSDLADPAWDLSRVALVGHSAGGHLALWAAARGDFDPSHPVYRRAALTPSGAVGLAAITDLRTFAEGAGSCPQAVPQLMGGSSELLPERYRLASPAALASSVPLVLLYGTVDPIVPMSEARGLPRARLRLIEGAGHFDLIHPLAPAFSALLEELGRLLGYA